MSKGFPILLAEDSKHDVLFVKRAFKKNKISNPLTVVPNGQACLDYLRNQGKYTDVESNPRPGIILMDINMPVMDGIEALKEIKADPDLKVIPIIMLTTSEEQQDITECYKNGANTYIPKPVEFDKFSEALQVIDTYWTLSKLS